MDQVILEPQPKMFACWSRSQKLQMSWARAGAWNL